MKPPTFKGWRRLRGNEYPRKADRFASVPGLHQAPQTMAYVFACGDKPASQHSNGYMTFVFYRRTKSTKNRSTK